MLCGSLTARDRIEDCVKAVGVVITPNSRYISCICIVFVKCILTAMLLDVTFIMLISVLTNVS